MENIFDLISNLRAELEECRYDGQNDTEVFNAVETLNKVDWLALKIMNGAEHGTAASILPHVSQRSELLKAFIRWNNKHNGIAQPVSEKMADNYLKSL